MEEYLKAGEKAPEFESVDQEGKPIKLADFRGSPVVLYFYPKDNTPGCTTEACNFRDNLESLQAHGIKVLGVSVDDQKSHKKFQEKYDLNFSLVVDDKKSITEKYKANGMFGAKRITYIIDGNGTIAYTYPKVKPNGHALEVLDKIKELKLID
ncbi:MAG: peroxiredoxin [Thermoplasmataceae archaeon]